MDRYHLISDKKHTSTPKLNKMSPWQDRDKYGLYKGFETEIKLDNSSLGLGLIVSDKDCY